MDFWVSGGRRGIFGFVVTFTILDVFFWECSTFMLESIRSSDTAAPAHASTGMTGTPTAQSGPTDTTDDVSSPP